MQGRTAAVPTGWLTRHTPGQKLAPVCVWGFWLILLLAGCQPFVEPQQSTRRPTQLALASPGRAGTLDPYYPRLGNGGYDVDHYTIALTVDAEQNRIQGTTTLTATATQPLSAFNLDFSGLTISAIAVQGAPALFSRQGSELTITPTLPLAADTLFTTTVTYEGTPRPLRDPGIPVEQLGWIQVEAGIFVISEPSGAMTWYPVNNHPTDKATYTFRITVAEPYMVAANGLLQAEIDLGDQRTYVWQVNQPMASYLATVGIAEFRKTEAVGPNGLPIINFLPVDMSAGRAKSFDQTAAMIEYFSSLVGPYPFDTYGAIVIDDPNFGLALETQSRSVFGLGSVFEPVIAHELAHQWFGDSVSPATWRDVWLNEGFATYLQHLWEEHTEGKAAFTRTMRNLYTFIEEAKLPPPARPKPTQLFGPSVYVRGAWTLHALRLQVGDETFFKILRTYHERFRYSHASTRDFIQVAEEVSGADLKELFDRWLYRNEVPPMPE